MVEALRKQNATYEIINEQLQVDFSKYKTKEVQDVLTPYVDRLMDLYVLNKNKYIVWNKNKNTYMTITNEYGKNQYLHNWQLVNHLLLKDTYGVFGRNARLSMNEHADTTKFLLFDVDFKNDISMAKWTVFKIAKALNELGIPNEYINVNWSGNKGYHVVIFFDRYDERYVTTEFTKKLFDVVCDLSDTTSNNVEFRGSVEYGVKLPLCVNFNSKNYGNEICWFVDYENGFKYIKSWDYLFLIKKIDVNILKRVIDNIPINTEVIIEENQTEKVIQDSNIINLKQYKINPNKSCQLNSDGLKAKIDSLLINGIVESGTRHDDTLLLAKYYNGLGYSEGDTEKVLLEWLDNQDNYSTKYKDAVKDTYEIVKYIYENNCKILIGRNKDITVNKNEIRRILDLKSVAEKHLGYAFLIWSKMYANSKGEFYFVKDKIVEVTGISGRQVSELINKLIEHNFINADRDRGSKIRDGKFIQEKNIYMINCNNESNDISNNECEHLSLNEYALKLFTHDELKKILPRTQYENIVNSTYTNKYKLNIL